MKRFDLNAPAYAAEATIKVARLAIAEHRLQISKLETMIRSCETVIAEPRTDEATDYSGAKGLDVLKEAMNRLGKEEMDEQPEGGKALPHVEPAPTRPLTLQRTSA